MARVLVVDDSPTDLAAIRKMLESDGHEVVELTEGGSALETVRSTQPDCVLMDVVMPGMNGFQATRAISKDTATQNIPIIVISSKSQDTDRLWALRQGAREYIVKPIKQADLLAKIRAVLEG
ncbi:response regulator [Algiphilus sp.]|uniref:response regulator n=1 Tax=Algiphilus sp. TaxID=1872431 RepID=UPI003B51AAED